MSFLNEDLQNAENNYIEAKISKTQHDKRHLFFETS